MQSILENLLIMVATIAILMGGAYLVLLILHWGLKLKSGSREQEGLTSMWVSAQKGSSSNRDESDDHPSSDDPA